MNSFSTTLIQLSYLVASALFILGLRDLGSPKTARRGNFLAAIAMFIAIIMTLLDKAVLNYEMILLGVIIGALIGTILARMIKMTAMPQMVGLFNGFGGGASALVAVAAFIRLFQYPSPIPIDTTLIILLGLLIGGVTFTGSLVAF